MKPIVQISLDLTTVDEALETAEIAVRAGVDWLEVGTPLVIAQGMRGVEVLRERYPDIPIIVDLKTMDGGWLEVELMARAGATHVVVMGQAHRETIELVVQAGADFGVQVPPPATSNPCFARSAARCTPTTRSPWDDHDHWRHEYIYVY